MFFFANFFFSYKLFSILFCQTSDYWRLRNNAFAAQIWSPELNRQKKNVFFVKNFSIPFRQTSDFWKLSIVWRLTKRIEKNISIPFRQTSDYWKLRKNAFAAQIWSPALNRQKKNVFFVKNFSTPFCQTSDIWKLSIVWHLTKRIEKKE
jgi:hypothetical protein